MIEFEYGQTIRITTEARNDNGLIDAATVTIKVEDPSGDKVTYTYGSSAELTRVSLGTYRLRIAVSEAGVWKYRWTTTGAAGVDEGKFLVTPQLVT